MASSSWSQVFIERRGVMERVSDARFIADLTDRLQAAKIKLAEARAVLNELHSVSRRQCHFCWFSDEGEHAGYCRLAAFLRDTEVG